MAAPATILCPKCQMPYQTDWAFCAYCGADRRPPGSRSIVSAHTHQFFAFTTFCHVCGAPRQAVQKRDRKWSWILYGIPCGVALIMATVGFWFFFSPRFVPNPTVDARGLPFTPLNEGRLTACVLWFIAQAIVVTAWRISAIRRLRFGTLFQSGIPTDSSL